MLNGQHVKEQAYQQVARELLNAMREEFSQLKVDDSSTAAPGEIVRVSKKLDLILRVLIGEGDMETAKKSVVYQMLELCAWRDTVNGWLKGIAVALGVPLILGSGALVWNLIIHAVSIKPAP